MISTIEQELMPGERDVISSEIIEKLFGPDQVVVIDPVPP